MEVASTSVQPLSHVQAYVEATSPESEDPGPDTGVDRNYMIKAVIPQLEFALVRARSD